MKLKRCFILFFALSICVVSGFAANYMYSYYRQNQKIEVKPKANLPNAEKSQVVSIIKHRLKEIEDCYNQRLEEGLQGEGALQIGWFLDGSGQVSELEEMKNEFDDPDLYDCSAEAISKWEFPKNLVLKVHYTFHLRQKRQPTSKNYNSNFEEL